MKHFLVRLVLVGGWLGAIETVRAQAVIEGRVKLPPARSAEVINKRYAMNVDAGLIEPDPPMAVVYLEGTFPKSKPSAQPVAQMSQKDMQFTNSLLPVLVGTKVEFPNEDDTYHNIFSYSKPKRFDLGRYRKEERPVPAQTFDKPGVEVLHCDIHEHMRAIILILETPFFQRTDTAGKYRMENLPAGRYKLKAWLSSKTTMEREVELKAGSTLQVNFP